jgi:hypothetical protein
MLVQSVHVTSWHGGVPRCATQGQKRDVGRACLKPRGRASMRRTLSLLALLSGCAGSGAHATAKTEQAAPSADVSVRGEPEDSGPGDAEPQVADASPTVPDGDTTAIAKPPPDQCELPEGATVVRCHSDEWERSCTFRLPDGSTGQASFACRSQLRVPCVLPRGIPRFQDCPPPLLPCREVMRMPDGSVRPVPPECTDDWRRLPFWRFRPVRPGGPPEGCLSADPKFPCDGGTH